MAADLISEIVNPSEEWALKSQSATLVAEIVRREGLSVWQELWPSIIALSNMGPKQYIHGLAARGVHYLHRPGPTLQDLGLFLLPIAKALQFIHNRGVAHLDVKPDNIYVKAGVYKLGDFGCATTIDKSLPVEEGNAHSMPLEILNENYDNLDKLIYSP